MQNTKWQPANTIEIVLAILVWLTLYASEFIASFFLRLTSSVITYYYVAIASTIVLALMIPLLGKKELVADIQEICLYDVFVQLVGLTSCIFHKSEAVYLFLAECVLILKMVRVAWPLLSYSGSLPAHWPSFGLLGFLRKRAEPGNRVQMTAKQRRRFYLLLLMMGISALVMQIALTFAVLPIPAIITVIFTLTGTRRLINKLEAREQQHSETLHALGVAEGVAAARAQMLEELAAKHSELERKNTELQALYEERDAMAQKLAARNDRLGDGTHDLKHSLLVLSYKANDLLAHAQDEQQRADAHVVKTEVRAIGEQIVKLVREAKIHNPKTALSPSVALPVKSLRDYFFSRFNPSALARGITLKCRPRKLPTFSIQSDEELLKRIIANLIANAITHGNPNSDVRVIFNRAPHCCYIRVCDTGPGMSNLNGPDRAGNFLALLESIAETKLTETSDAEKDVENFSGNGVGLHSVYRLGKELGTTIELQSWPGRGTVFRFKVPLAN